MGEIIMDVTLSSYKTVWAEFVPKSGKVTVHDQKTFGSSFVQKNLKSYRRVFPSLGGAKQFVREFNKVLDTEYTVYYSSDKQFGLAKESDGYAIPYTKKQLEEYDTIAKKMTVDAIFNAAYEELDFQYIKALLREDTRKERMIFLIEKVEDVVGPAQMPSRIRKAADTLYWKIF